MAVEAKYTPIPDSETSLNDAGVCHACGQPELGPESAVKRKIRRLKHDISVAVYDGRDEDAGESHSELVAAEMWLADIRNGNTP